jgi:hypothetical protein
MIVIKNGKKVKVGPAGVSGSDIIKAADPAPGRIAVVSFDDTDSRGGDRIIKSNRHYRPRDLQSRSGKWVRITDSPDRSKGGQVLAA